MTQFLRFQVSGSTFLLWLLLFLIPYVNWRGVPEASAGYVISAIAGVVVLALPIGVLIHQTSVTLLSPFREHRLFGRRRVTTDALPLFSKHYPTPKDRKWQAALVLSKSLKVTWEEPSTPKRKFEVGVSSVNEEIRNRYSYYYVRIDNGLIAPLAAYALGRVVLHVTVENKLPLFSPQATISPYLMPSIALLICIALLAYVPEILREIDDIEIDLLRRLGAPALNSLESNLANVEEDDG